MTGYVRETDQKTQQQQVSSPNNRATKQQLTKPQSRSIPSFGQLTQVNAQQTEAEGRRGRKFEARDGVTYFVPQRDWQKATIAGKPVWYHKDAQAHTTRTE